MVSTREVSSVIETGTLTRRTSETSTGAASEGVSVAVGEDPSTGAVPAAGVGSEPFSVTAAAPTVATVSAHDASTDASTERRTPWRGGGAARWCTRSVIGSLSKEYAPKHAPQAVRAKPECE